LNGHGSAAREWAVAVATTKLLSTHYIRMTLPRLTPGDVVPRTLDGPPPLGFDCGQDAQNRFLYDYAWPDQVERISATHLYYVRGLLAAYCTLCLDALELGTRERAKEIRFKRVGALKLAQLGVDVRFQGAGLGALVVSDVTNIARDQWKHAGCRFVTVDARPELVGWYERQGFRVNRVMQNQRVQETAGKRDPLDIPVSMRLDLRGL
jgi:GNAT superfamily N-acetyltransferase